MREDEDKAYDGGGLKGPLYWLAGVTSAIALKAANGPGGVLGGILGGNPPPDGPNAPVSREVMDLKTENAMLKANAHADAMAAAQAVVNAKQEARLDCHEKQIDALFSLTRLMVPASNVVPPPATVSATAPAASGGSGS